MSSVPTVSVVMSVFNGDRYLKEAIDSVLAQNFADFELIVVDDGSTDGTAAILESYSDSRIRTSRNAVNLGQPASLNRGLAAARGALIARLDADDVALPDRLETQVRFLASHPSAASVGAAWIEIDENGCLGAARHPPTTSVDIRWRLLFANAFLHSSVIVRRSALDAVGVYDPAIGYGEDYELWSRVAARFEVANIDRPLVLYRLTGVSKTATIPTAQQTVDSIAGANIDRLSPNGTWSLPSSAELAFAGRRLLLGRDVDLDGPPAVRLARDLLELQRSFADFFQLDPRAAARHRASVSATLAARLRSIGRATGDWRARRSGLRLLIDAARGDLGILIGRGRS